MSPKLGWLDQNEMSPKWYVESYGKREGWAYISAFNPLYSTHNLSSKRVSRLTKDMVLMRFVKDRESYEEENKGKKGISENIAYAFCHCEPLYEARQSLTPPHVTARPRSGRGSLKDQRNEIASSLTLLAMTEEGAKERLLR
ncbi:hypothetical protein JCM13991_18660 [Thermodesulfovibrio hydrogeniphilus]